MRNSACRPRYVRGPSYERLTERVRVSFGAPDAFERAAEVSLSPSRRLREMFTVLVELLIGRASSNLYALPHLAR